MTISNICSLFPDTYEDSRARFRDDLSFVQVGWPDAKLDQHSIGTEDDLTIDWIQADAKAKRSKLLILTSGEHGAEGYVGSAMMQLFIEEYLEVLNP